MYVASRAIIDAVSCQALHVRAGIEPDLPLLHVDLVVFILIHHTCVHVPPVPVLSSLDLVASTAELVGWYWYVQAVELRTKTTYGLGPCVHRAGSGSESIDTTLIGLRTMTSCV